MNFLHFNVNVFIEENGIATSTLLPAKKKINFKYVITKVPKKWKTIQNILAKWCVTNWKKRNLPRSSAL